MESHKTGFKANQDVNVFSLAQNNNFSGDNSKKRKQLEDVTSKFFEVLSTSVSDYFEKQGQLDPSVKVEEATEIFFEKLTYFVADYFEKNNLETGTNKQLEVEAGSFFDSVVTFVNNYFRNNFGVNSRNQYKKTATQFLASFVPDINGFLKENEDVLTGKISDKTVDLQLKIYNYSRAMEDASNQGGSKFKVDC